MIFVTVGTLRLPFERMAEGINAFSDKKGREKLVVQAGYTRGFLAGKGCEVGQFFSQLEMERMVKRAQIVVSHGGEGTLLRLLSLVKSKPVVFPRDPKYGEHVDGQQLEIAEELRRRGWVRVAGSVLSLVKMMQVPVEPLAISGNLFEDRGRLIRGLKEFTRL